MARYSGPSFSLSTFTMARIRWTPDCPSAWCSSGTVRSFTAIVAMPPARPALPKSGDRSSTKRALIMILYKFTSLDAAYQIVNSARIGFSRPSYFNDPYDRPVATPIPTEDSISGAFAEIGATMKSHIWEQKTAVLSLTRSPSNMLMWAHYADGHSGAVLEINAMTANFVDIRTNMIPAQFGSVIYSRTRPTEQYQSKFAEGVVVGATHHFVLSHYEKWQRLFLTKPLEWAYEEEVRVAKCLDGLEAHGNSSNESGNCKVIELQGKPLHCFEIPRQSIRRILVGVRANESIVAQLIQEHPDISVCRALLSETGFKVNFRPIRSGAIRSRVTR